MKKYAKRMERTGRLKQRYARAARYDDIAVSHDLASGHGQWPCYRYQVAAHQVRRTHFAGGVYCLRTNPTEWDEATLWRICTRLTGLEAVFRSLKSALELRPVYQHKTGRVSARLFILLVYLFAGRLHGTGY
ncbi:MAG: hypothetical protein GKR94_14565 [Gammaproteobacteria bacterium]|nr:hypothetical protein [Gammaproteobacteria bacterium]